MSKIYKSGRKITDAKIASNSLELTSEDLVQLSGGFLIKAATTGALAGITKTTKTFNSDNETVGLEKALVINDNDLRLKLNTTATITQDEVGSLFNINANQDVDAATAGTGEQLILEEIIDDTVGIFSIA